MKFSLYPMGVGYLSISAVFTVLSFVGLQYWTELSYVKLKSDGLMGENLLHRGVASRVAELLLGSSTTFALVVNFVLNIFILIVLSLKVFRFSIILYIRKYKWRHLCVCVCV